MFIINISNGCKGDKVLGDYWGSGIYLLLSLLLYYINIGIFMFKYLLF